MATASEATMVARTGLASTGLAGTVTHTTLGTSLGDLTVVGRDGSVTGLYYPHHWYLPDRAAFGEYRDDGFAGVRQQLEEYLAGERREFDVPAETAGSPFQEQVWQLIRQVPYGATVSYGELAGELGGGVTAREVGAATGRNPVSIVIPCHRVVSASGGLTGYAGGLRRKRALLDLEQQVAGRAVRLF